MVRGLLLVGIILIAIILMGCFSFLPTLTMVVYKKYHIKF
jgi:ABC-type lipoprotein release transport system permease subunit